MIELHRLENSQEGDRIQAALKELRAAHQIVVHQAAENVAVPLPAIKDSGEWISGEDAIAEYLEKLEELLSHWTWFAGDACYIDEDGEVC